MGWKWLASDFYATPHTGTFPPHGHNGLSGLLAICVGQAWTQARRQVLGMGHMAHILAAISLSLRVRSSSRCPGILALWHSCVLAALTSSWPFKP